MGYLRMNHKCLKCGVVISDEVKFCPNCGSAQSVSKKKVKAKKQVIQQKPLISGINIIYFITLISLIIVGIYGYRYVVPAKNPDPHFHGQETTKTAQRPAFDQDKFNQLLARLSVNPGSFEEHVDLGNFLFDHQRYNEALDYYQKALEIKPDDVDVIIDAGVSYFNTRQFEQAKIFFERALALDENHPNALYNFGVVSAQMGDMSRMIEVWEKLIEVAPESPAAQNARRMIEQVKVSNKKNN
jgi:cytochrome c-type biogenesis protein CcmH/NrfG